METVQGELSRVLQVITSVNLPDFVFVRSHLNFESQPLVEAQRTIHRLKFIWLAKLLEDMRHNQFMIVEDEVAQEA